MFASVMEFIILVHDIMIVIERNIVVIIIQVAEESGVIIKDGN